MEYSRQLYVIGKDSMVLMEKSSVLIVGLNGLGIEVAKNIILCGVKNVYLYDDQKASIGDVGYYIMEDDVGRNRAEIVKGKLAHLNPQCNVTVVDQIDLDRIGVVVVVDRGLEELIKINDMCKRTKFISCGTNDFTGVIFCDFGEEFIVRDPDGEDLKRGLVAKVDLDTVITSLDAHKLSRGDKIVFDGVETRIVKKVLGRMKFSVDHGVDKAVKFLQQKDPVTLNFKPLRDCLQHKDFFDKPGHKLVPMQSVIGGIVSQEVLKAITGKFTPIHQWFHFDAGIKTREKPLVGDDSRYCGQIDLLGIEVQERINQSTVFIVGAGAIGCEHLKNFGMMGFNLAVTDMDSIEKSNLCRQFLFDGDDIGKNKAIVACNKVRQMNNHIDTVAYQDKICKGTLDRFDEAFFDKISIIATALDNTDTRIFLDELCLLHQKPLIDSGTLGTKASTQCIIPGLSELYGTSDDPVETEVPACTLKHFPYLIEHTIQFARDYFEGLFVKKSVVAAEPEELFNQLFRNPIIELLADEKQEWNGTNKKKPVPISFDNGIEAHKGFVEVTKCLLGSVIPEFEKDNDDHIRFVTVVSNLRAQNYGIEQQDEFTTKKIAGKIIPAIATTTSLVSGLVALEAYKIVLGMNRLDDYKNYFVNLAIPLFTGSEPIEGKWLWELQVFKDPLVSDIWINGVDSIMFEKGTVIADYMETNKKNERKKRKLIDMCTEIDNNVTVPFLVTVLTDDDKVHKYKIIR